MFANVKQEVDIRASIKDQSGRTIEIDLREDEESKEKYGQIIDLLLAAGYFRARISSLPPFDKVVGGLVWCISTCNVDLDVDLLYQENSTIGQKISLTEKIVAVLPRMKCPHELQPHQIQGLDCIKIFPVVQWLVKKAMEYREETAQFIRSYSEMMFDFDYLLPSQKEHNDRVKETVAPFRRYLDRCTPVRVYRKPNNTKHLDIKLQAQSTLLEYGNMNNLLEYSSYQGEESGESKTSKKEVEAEREKEEEEAQKQINETNIKKLLKNLASQSTSADQANVSQLVGNILLDKTDEIQRVNIVYEGKQAKIMEETNKTESMILQHTRAVTSLHKEIAKNEELIEKNNTLMLEMRETYNDITEEIEELENKVTIAKSKISELEELHEQNVSLSVAERKQLEDLIVKHEDIIKTCDTFKKTCTDKIKEQKECLVEVQEKISKLESDKKAVLVYKQHQTDKAKLDKLRLQIAKKNYNISALQRQVDEIPSRIELLQYQKRFEELHDQTAKVHTETKQFYTLFNNLSDTKACLDKHLVRLNSINESFRKVVNNVQASAIFLTQFEQLVTAAKQGRAAIEKKRDEVKTTKNGVNDVYLGLIDQQRQYTAMVKNFQDECKKNEKLLAKCKSLGI